MLTAITALLASCIYAWLHGWIQMGLNEGLYSEREALILEAIIFFLAVFGAIWLF